VEASERVKLRTNKLEAEKLVAVPAANGFIGTHCCLKSSSQLELFVSMKCSSGYHGDDARKTRQHHPIWGLKFLA